MSAPLHIVFAANDGYAPHMGVALASLLETREPATRVVVHILDGGISPANRQRLTRVADAHRSQAQLEFIRPDESLVGSLPLRHYYRSPVYYRYWMHLFLPAEVRRALYLDCDMVVCRDLTALYETDLGDCPVGAVQDKYADQAPLRLPGWPIGALDYFNTGMLVLDIAAWRASGRADAMREILTRNTGAFLVPDQDAFNLACRGVVRELPFAWNYQIVGSPDADRPGETWIIHYLGDMKPWNIWNTHPLRRRYRAARWRTPWRFHPYAYRKAQVGLLIQGGRILPEVVKRPLRALLGIPPPGAPKSA